MGEENHAVGAPGAASSGPGFADNLWRTSGEIDLHELVVREEADPAAVRRPEGGIGVLRAGQRLQAERVERPHPQGEFPGGVAETEGKAPAVRRDRYAVDGHFFRQRDAEPYERRIGRLLAEVNQHKGEREHAQHARRGDPQPRPSGMGFRPFGLVLLDKRIANIPQPPLPVLLQTPFQQPPHPGRRLTRQPRPIRLLGQHRRQRVRDRFALKQALPRQHLVQHHAKGPHVRPLVHHRPARLLRRHVRRRPQDQSILRPWLHRQCR